MIKKPNSGNNKRVCVIKLYYNKITQSFFFVFLQLVAFIYKMLKLNEYITFLVLVINLELFYLLSSFKIILFVTLYV